MSRLFFRNWNKKCKKKTEIDFYLSFLFYEALYIGTYLRCLESLMNNELYCFDGDQIFVQFHRRNIFL